MIELSVVIPCFNESNNLPIIYENIKKKLNKKNIEVVIVDNGSTDNSGSFLNSIKDTNIKVIKIKKNIGYGNGIIQGLIASKGKILCWTHGDLQCDFNDIIKSFQLYKKTNNRYLIVKGKRQNRSFFDEIMTKGMQIISSIILNVKLNDINAQPKMFGRIILDLLIKNNPPNDFSLDLFLLFIGRKNHISIIDLPVHFNERKYGEAKGGGGSIIIRIKIIFRTLSYIYNIKNNFKK